MKTIQYKGKVAALILAGRSGEKGTHFFTSQDNPFQLGVLNYKKGDKIKAHIHKVFARKIEGTQELFQVLSGQVKVNFYSPGGQKFQSAILKTGDTLLVLSAGHGFELLKNSKILVVKQGPYRGIKEDKSYFNNSL